jgi:hypothetical protein
MTFNPAGSLIEMMRGVSPANLTSPVPATIRQAGRGSKVGTFELVARGMVLTVYDSSMTRNGLRREVALGSDCTWWAAD